MKLKLRNRIAFYYLAATTILTALLFIVVYTIIYKTIYNHVDEKLSMEMREVSKGIYAGKDTVILINLYEWEEREHSQIEINPAYLEIVDSKGQLIKKSDNLLNSDLEFVPVVKENIFFNSILLKKQIRQLQYPITSADGGISGYMLVGLPMEENILILNNIERTLIFGFLAALVMLFFITRWIAEKSIVPIHKVTSTAEKITKENLYQRIELPKNKDEIYTLTTTVNGLLDRLEDAVLREKQFTADASHELRTPLSVIKGTLEVLIRKPREVEQYESKIAYCIREVNRMTQIIDQLLLLARYESEKIEAHTREVDLTECVRYSMLRVEQLAENKQIKMNLESERVYNVSADPFMLNVIIENLLSNAIKYSNGSKKIDIIVGDAAGSVTCSIKDYGIGMTTEVLSKIYDRFYRSEIARTTRSPGDGIGLAIVKRLADLQNLDINFTSEPGKGTTAVIAFHTRS